MTVPLRLNVFLGKVQPIMFAGNLTIDEGCRRLIPGDIWFRLKSYFPDSPEFTGASELCHECLVMAV